MAEKKETKTVKTLVLKSVVSKPQVFNLVGRNEAIYVMPGQEVEIKESEISFEIENALGRGDIIKK